MVINMSDNILDKKDNESKLEYIKRIVYGKLVDKTLSEYDYVVLAPLVFEKKYSSDVARRMFYGARYILDVLDDEQLNKLDNNEIIKKIEEKTKDLEKERKKLQATKIEYNRNLRHDSKQELLYENIKDAIKRLPVPKFNINNTKIDCKNNSSAYMLCIADLHYGADFVSDNNIYNREICKKRIEQLTNKVINKCKTLNVSKLNITTLGDCIQGMLRISDVKINDVPVVECVVEVSRLIAQMLNEISKVTYITYYHTMASNHSQTRPLNSKQLLAEEDLEVIIGNYIKDMLRYNKRIKVILSNKDYNSIQLVGQNILMLHGHQIKNLNNVIKDYSIQHKKWYDIVICGHLHGGSSKSLAELNGNTELKVVPSIVGSDPYSDSLKVGSKSMSKMYKIEKGNGITEEYTFVLN